MSYREIARRLGCSTYKMWELISPHKSVQSRIKQVAELAQKLGGLSKRISEIEGKISRIEGLESLAELLSRIEYLERVTDMIEDDLVITRFSALYKVFDEPCKWIDEEGYCTLRHLEEWGGPRHELSCEERSRRWSSIQGERQRTPVAMPRGAPSTSREAGQGLRGFDVNKDERGYHVAYPEFRGNELNSTLIKMGEDLLRVW